MLLGDPQTHIIQAGGHIFIAELDGTVVGCCALIPAAPGHMLLGKMAVSTAHRNLGIGRKLLAHTIAEARSLGLRLITLETNHILTNAIHLYASLGFNHVPPHRIAPSHYSRADIFMELYL